MGMQAMEQADEGGSAGGGADTGAGEGGAGGQAGGDTGGQQQGDPGQSSGQQQGSNLFQAAGGEGRQPGEGGQAEGGDDDPLKASTTEDGRPKVTLSDGREVPLPDQFWDAENSQPRTDAMLKSFMDTKSSYDRLANEKKELEQKLQQGQQQSTEGVPEKPEEYKFEKPEGVTREIPDDDPLLSTFRQIAHDNGIPQDQFQKMAGQYLAKVEETVGPPLDLNAEREKLGPNADTILHENARWVDSLVDSGTLSQDEKDELLSLGETATGVKALNKIRQSMGEKPIPMEGAQMSELPSKQEWYAMVGSEKYAQDPGYREYVDNLGKKLFGTGPAGSSEAGLGVRG